MVVFNDPVPVPNPELQAVQMALDMRVAIGALIEKWRRLGSGRDGSFQRCPVPNPELQAVQMALDMRVAIGALIEKWRRLGHDLVFGIGISHGFATRH